MDIRYVVCDVGVSFFMPDQMFCIRRCLVLDLRSGNVRSGVVMAGVWVRMSDLVMLDLLQISFDDLLIV